jgi:hypothetical protein
LKSFDVITAFYYFQYPSAHVFYPVNQFARVATICSYELQTREFSFDFFQDELGAITVMDIGCMDYNHQH